MQQEQVILLNRHHHKEVDQRAIHVDYAKNHSFKGKYGQLYVFYDRVKDDFFVTTSSDPTDLAARIDISADVKVVTEKPVLINQPVLGVQQTSVLVADNKVGALSPEQLQSISNPVTASAPARVIEASRVTDTTSGRYLCFATSSAPALITSQTTQKPISKSQSVIGTPQTSLLNQTRTTAAQKSSNSFGTAVASTLPTASKVNNQASQSVLGHAASSTTHLNTEKKKEDVKKGGFLSNLFGRK